MTPWGSTPKLELLRPRNLNYHTLQLTINIITSGSTDTLLPCLSFLRCREKPLILSCFPFPVSYTFIQYLVAILLATDPI